jgi:hypothetical protein
MRRSRSGVRSGFMLMHVTKFDAIAQGSGLGRSNQKSQHAYSAAATLLGGAHMILHPRRVRRGHVGATDAKAVDQNRGGTEEPTNTWQRVSVPHRISQASPCN